MLRTHIGQLTDERYRVGKRGNNTYPRKAVLLARGMTDDETGRRYAMMLTSPEFAAYRIEKAIQPASLADEIDVPGLLAALQDHASAVNEGDLSRAEAMLINQADALQALFVNLTERSLRQEYLVHAESFMRLALKAQSQCRATLETLSNMKNPPVVYARQANVTTGPQQINNGVDPTRARENQNTPNQLLGAVDELRQDTGASGSAVKNDPPLEAVAKVHRAKDGEG
jgi:hypothetical protein